MFGKRKTEMVLNQMYFILSNVLKTVYNKCKTNSQNCYALWTVDFGITKDYLVKLYELNGGSPDMAFGHNVKKVDTSKYFFETLHDTVLAPMYNLKPKYKKSYIDITDYKNPRHT